MNDEYDPVNEHMNAFCSCVGRQEVSSNKTKMKIGQKQKSRSCVGKHNTYWKAGRLIVQMLKINKKRS